MHITSPGKLATFDCVCVRSKPFTLSTNHFNFLQGTSACPVESFVTLWNVTVNIKEGPWLFSNAAVQLICIWGPFLIIVFASNLQV